MVVHENAVDLDVAAAVGAPRTGGIGKGQGCRIDRGSTQEAVAGVDVIGINARNGKNRTLSFNEHS